MSGAVLNDIFLHPGEFYFGHGAVRVRTLLGSCIAVTLWSPRLRVGGMCHYLLPAQPAPHTPANGKYADGAFRLFDSEIKRLGCAPHEFEVKLFGGARMWTGHEVDTRLDVAARNIDAARRLAHDYGWTVTAESVGGYCHRTVILDLGNGDTWLRLAKTTNQEQN